MKTDDVVVLGSQAGASTCACVRRSTTPIPHKARVPVIKLAR